MTNLIVELAVDIFRISISVDQFEGVGAIAIHVVVAVWDPRVTEQE